MTELTQAVLRVFARCVEVPGTGSFRKIKCFPAETPGYFLRTLLKACGWTGHVFASSASPTHLFDKGRAVYPPLVLVNLVSIIANMWHSSSGCMRHSWPAKFGAFCLNERVHTSHFNPFSVSTASAVHVLQPTAAALRNFL